MTARIIRSLVSYLPSNSLLGPRRLRDLPRRILGRPHEADFELLRRLDLACPTVVDVGANRGQSIDSFHLVLSAPRIVAIEPNPLLAGSLAQRYPDVTVIPCGLGAAPGSITLHIPRYGHTHWDTRASLHREHAEAFLSSDNFAGFQPSRACVESSPVTIRTMDELRLEPDILKIDAEGFEANILRGAEVTLRRHPLILLETADTGVFDVLEPLGYRAFQAACGRLRPGRGGLNTYFLTPRHEALFPAAVFHLNP